MNGYSAKGMTADAAIDPCMTAGGAPEARRFNFGHNWRAFSERALNAERVAQARADFLELTAGMDVTGETFLDIGFGQGLSLLAAASMGARVVGLDLDPVCADVLDANRHHFPGLPDRDFTVRVGSILDPAVVMDLTAAVPGGGAGYDIVHSWGVLHHTGDMWAALHNAASLVRPGGRLILALYNRHVTSPAWKVVKRAYCLAPPWGQAAMIRLFYPVIWAAKRLVTGRNPAEMTRGMDFLYNVIDWVGGWPYEYASVDEVTARMDGMGFDTVRVIPAGTPTGCNEFVCRRRPAGGDHG